MRQGRLSSESGFTLIELLVVVLILGILAAIAIPNFLNQQAKAHDASAKSAARNAQTAMQLYEMENHGSYAGVDQADLAALDSSLDPGNIAIAVTTPPAGGYKLDVTTPGSTPVALFTVVRDDNGKTTRTCNLPGTGGCQKDEDGNGVW